MKLNIVPASKGLDWFKQGVRIFAKQPLAMTGLFLAFMITVAVLTLIPLIGSLLALIILPAATLGYMVATHEAVDGKFPMPTLLIAAFRAGRQRFHSMLVLGGLYALGFMAVIGLSALADGGQFAKLYLLGGSMDSKTLADDAVMSAVYLFFLLYLPLSLAFWHAPALVHWHGLSPAKSLFFSFVACVRNFKAFAVYGLAWFALTLFAGMLVSLVGGLVGNPAVAGALMLPVVLTVAAMFFSSLFFTFRDCFITTPEAPPSDPGQDAAG
jgi:hypothetical protein